MKFLKVGRVAIITRGRYAGKKVRTDEMAGMGEKCSGARQRMGRVTSETTSWPDINRTSWD